MASISYPYEITRFLGAGDEWDAPLYKKWTKTDIGLSGLDGRRSNQGGPLVPVVFSDYMPAFPSQNSDSPASNSITVTLDLWVGTLFWGTAVSNYLYETRKGKRTREYRITGELAQWRKQAKPGDLLVLQRKLTGEKYFRLVIVSIKSLSPSCIPHSRCGLLFADLKPVTESDIDSAALRRCEFQKEEFQLQPCDRKKRVSLNIINARSRDFSTAVHQQYGYACALCGEGLRTPNGGFEVEAAHIIPVASNGPDDVRNGLSLCRKHHWAFDRGMWSLSDECKVIVPEQVIALPENQSLRTWLGHTISSPGDIAVRPHPIALRWHRDYVLMNDS